jgi:hypothetical protein
MIEVEKLTKHGETFYYIKGTNILHREEGPAMEWYDGTKVWYLNGKCHREDGPAAILYGGKEQWYLYDIFFKTKEEWFENLNEEQKAKALYSEYFIRG